MKANNILAMLGFLAAALAASAQITQPVTTDAAAASTNATVQTVTASATTDAAAASTNATVQTVTASATTDGAGTVTANVAVESKAEAPAAAIAPAPMPPASPTTIIPLIVMDDVPLTDAIKNLARQAGLNYMLDPRLTFGQIGADGKPVPQPTVSIRWENITAEQALTALINNYGLQLVDDPKTKIARVGIKDPAAPEPLIARTVQLKYASPSNILAAVQTTLVDKRSKVMADVRTSQLVVLATEKELDGVDKLVASLDTPTKQVLIEAKLIETSIKPSSVKGIDWSGTLQAQNVSLGNNLQSAPVQNNLSDNKPLASAYPKMMLDTAKGFNPATAFLDADGVSAVISFLNTYSDAKVVSEPRTVTLDNEPARIEITTEYPIFTTTAGTANTPGGSSITYSNLGVILDVTPRITADNRVNLKITPEVSRIDSVSTVYSQGTANTAYIFDSRRMESTVMIPSGFTLVLGGLLQDSINLQNSKVPFLGDIPFLGHIFRSDSKKREKDNLLIFLTPTIIKDSDFQETKTTFLQTSAHQPEEPDWGAKDSGKPYDWSNLSGKPKYQ